MNKIKFLIIFTIMIGTLQMSYAQENESNRELKVSDDEKIIICYRCGRKGHKSTNCYASKHRKGYYL